MAPSTREAGHFSQYWIYHLTLNLGNQQQICNCTVFNSFTASYVFLIVREFLNFLENVHPVFKLKICSSIFWRVWFFIHSSVLFKNDVYIYSSFFQIVNIIIIASLSLGTCQWCNHTVKFVETAVYIESFHNFSLGVDDHRLGGNNK